MSKIETNIEELEQYIDSCKYSPLSNSKIVVNKDEILEIIDNLKRSVPEEIKKYQRIIANRDAILRDAQDKAEEMIKKANEMTSQLVSEHEVMQQAYKEANVIIDNATTEAGRIIDKATAQANAMKDAAVSYTDESLGSIQKILNDAIESVTINFDGIKRALESSLEVTIENRNALDQTEQITPPEDVDVPEEPVYGSENPMNQKEAEGQEDEEPAEQELEEAPAGGIQGPSFADNNMSVEEAEARGQVDIDYNDIRYGGASKKDDLDDFSIGSEDFK